MNVVLVTIDCLRQDRCGIYGHHRDTTPTLDALGREGYVFDNAFATGPGTTESFPGILAGRLSADTLAGDTIHQKCLPRDAPTLAEHLRDAGWSTGAVLSNPRIGTHVGSDRGFQTFDNLRIGDRTTSTQNTGSASLLPDVGLGERLYRIRERLRDLDSVPLRYEVPFLALRYHQYLFEWPSIRGETVVDGFLEMLDEQDSPFFAWTHLMDIHGPIHPDTVADGGLWSGNSLEQFGSQARRMSDVYDPLTETRYDSAVRYVDDQLRRIVDWLKAEQLWDETAIIVTADHGEALYDRGIYGHRKYYTYDEVLKVPLVVKVPDQEGDRLDRSFSLGWLHELVSELCELESMEVPLSSSNDTHLAKNSQSDEDEVVLADSIGHRGHSIVAYQEDTKYVRQTNELAGAHEIEVQDPGTYRLRIDPNERNPTGEQVPSLQHAADDIEIDDPTELRSPDGPTRIDEAAEDRLKQLGYAE